MNAAIHEFTVRTDDGVMLAATSYRPPGESRAIVVISSAMATPRRYYAKFAEWLAERGYSAITYDYRGIGDSQPTDIIDCGASIGDWVHRDMAAILSHARQLSEDGPLYVVAHSLAGQVIGLLGDRFDIDAAATFSAQIGYWRIQYPGQGWKLLIITTAFVPAVTRLFGYFPWRAIFGGEDLPSLCLSIRETSRRNGVQKTSNS